ncbi:C2H2 transcription factor [Purpureocillium lilacinum]|nr:C2H2 transcription factor [Purpureocillium lilacinum]OAQ91899.1 C2H2 transcription factor [Purpureocillium lilacinum]
MDGSHLPFDAHMGAASSSAAGMASLSLDFDAFMAADHSASHGLGPFEPCVHDDACLDNHHHFRQPKASNKLNSSFAQPYQAGVPVSAGRGHGQSAQQRIPATAPTSPTLDNGQPYTWESLFNDHALDNAALHTENFGFCQDDDCASECSSACDGSCPSQCGDTGHGICCDDDACGSPNLCLDEACQGASHPCNDESCLADNASEAPSKPNPAMTDGDKAAAAALASFGDGQLQMMQDAQAGFMQASPTAPPPTRDGQMSFMNLPQTLPCGSLSLDSMYPSTSPGFSHQQFQMAFEYALANHIMQYHDPSRGMAHAGNCLANDPGQFISKCTLPKFSANDNVTDPYLSQLQGGHECGFQVQDPNAFAHHIFEEHRPALMLHAQHFRQPGVPQSNIHVHHGVSHHHGSHTGSHMGSQMIQGKNFSPSPSPLAALSMGPSLSTTPSSSLATPSPLESETGFTEPSSSARSKSPHAESKPHILTEEDQFRCRWVMGDGSGICGHRFDNDEELQKHCKLDHLKPLKKVRGGFRCGWEGCTRDTCFTQRSKVERHMQVHTGYKPVQCTICGAALSAKQALDQHMRIHTGETPWVCKYPGCGCAFKQQSALTMHERTHTGDKPLECEICGKRFSESSNLSKHRRTHNVKGMHECQLCGKDFHRLDQLRRHMGTNHKDRPAEVDALLSKAKSKMQAQKVSKAARKNKGKGDADGLSADALELIEDHLESVVIAQDSL